MGSLKIVFIQEQLKDKKLWPWPQRGLALAALRPLISSSNVVLEKHWPWAIQCYLMPLQSEDP